MTRTTTSETTATMTISNPGWGEVGIMNRFVDSGEPLPIACALAQAACAWLVDNAGEIEPGWSYTDGTFTFPASNWSNLVDKADNLVADAIEHARDDGYTDPPRFPAGTPEYETYAAELKTELAKFAAGAEPYPYVTNSRRDTKHTCNPAKPGHPLPFGRRDPEGKCPRCVELNAGATPREAPAWTSRYATNGGYPTTDEIRAHAELHRTGRATCGPVCTFGEW